MAAKVKAQTGDKVKLQDSTLGKIITPLSMGGYVMEEKQTMLLREISEEDILEIIRDGFTLFKAIKNLIGFFKGLFSKKAA